MFTDIQGSVEALTGAFVINLMLFWLTYILGQGWNKDLTSRIPYYLVGIYSFIVLIAAGCVFTLQVTGNLTVHEMYTAKMYNTYNKKCNTEEKSSHSYKCGILAFPYFYSNFIISIRSNWHQHYNLTRID